jgi:hypothetical protein
VLLATLTRIHSHVPSAHPLPLLKSDLDIPREEKQGCENYQQVYLKKKVMRSHSVPNYDADFGETHSTGLGTRGCEMQSIEYWNL